MTTNGYSVNPQRGTGLHRTRMSVSNALPVYSSSSAVKEKYARMAKENPWFIPFHLPLPGSRLRHLHVYVINPRRLHAFSTTRFGRKRGTVLLCFLLTFLVLFTFALVKRFGGAEKKWPGPFQGEPRSLIFKREDLQRIWNWEVASGHYPSRHRSE